MRATTLTARVAGRGFSRIVSRAEFLGERVLITRNGRPAAALVSVDDLHELQGRASEPAGKEK